MSFSFSSGGGRLLTCYMYSLHRAHLYKRHALPLQCPRCWEPFRGEGFYRQHLQQDPPCVVEAVQRNMLDGFTKEQEEMLRSRRRVRPGTGPADKWREIYMILFPDDNVDNIPSPCKPNLGGGGEGIC